MLSVVVMICPRLAAMKYRVAAVFWCWLVAILYVPTHVYLNSKNDEGGIGLL